MTDHERDSRSTAIKRPDSRYILQRTGMRISKRACKRICTSELKSIVQQPTCLSIARPDARERGANDQPTEPDCGVLRQGACKMSPRRTTTKIHTSACERSAQSKASGGVRAARSGARRAKRAAVCSDGCAKALARCRAFADAVTRLEPRACQFAAVLRLIAMLTMERAITVKSAQGSENENETRTTRVF